jgi:hypothetical protein
VSNVKKINHGLPLCQNNVNGVYMFFVIYELIKKNILRDKANYCKGMRDNVFPISLPEFGAVIFL